MAHFVSLVSCASCRQLTVSQMEPPIKGGGPVSEDRWTNKVLEVLKNPGKEVAFGKRFKHPATLALPKGTLAPDTKPQVFVMSPRNATGGWLYDTRVKKIIELLGFPNAKVNEKFYIKDPSRFEEFEKKSNGKMMVEYSPEQLNEEYKRRKPNKAIWRVYMEDSMTEHLWDDPPKCDTKTSESSDNGKHAANADKSNTACPAKSSSSSSDSRTSGSASATSHAGTTASATSAPAKSTEPSKVSSAPQASSTANKGNCPAGKILDPAEGGQDQNTKDPKCIADDDSKCAAGQKAATRKPELADDADWTPDCAPDDGKDHECKDTNTYDHREIINGKIQHSCRSTRKSQRDQQDAYAMKSKDAAADKANKDKTAEEERKEKAKRTRTGWCFVALAGVEAPDFTNEIVNAMSQDEIDGLTGLWADDGIPSPPGEGDIPDQNVKFTEVGHVTGIVSADAGWGSLFTALGKIFGKAGDDAAGATKAGSSATKTLRAGSKAAPAAKALDAAKASSRVKKMLGSQRFRDCLAATAGAAASALDDAIPQQGAKFDGTWGIYEVDWSLGDDPKYHPVPDDDPERNIQVNMGDETDSIKSGQGSNMRTHHDGYHRSTRIYYEDCSPVVPYLNNMITDLEVWNGCCAFYDGDNCEKETLMFSMTNRPDGELRGKHNDAVSSMWCTFDGGCKGAPGI